MPFSKWPVIVPFSNVPFQNLHAKKVLFSRELRPIRSIFHRSQIAPVSRERSLRALSVYFSMQ